MSQLKIQVLTRLGKGFPRSYRIGPQVSASVIEQRNVVTKASSQIWEGEFGPVSMTKSNLRQHKQTFMTVALLRIAVVSKSAIMILEMIQGQITSKRKVYASIIYVRSWKSIFSNRIISK